MITLKTEQQDDSLKEYMLILDDPRKKDLVDLGNNLFPNSKKRELETQRGVLIEKQKVANVLESLRGKYKTVFSAEEIKQECLEYGLDISTAANYQGDFDYDYIEKIQKFINENNLQLQTNDIKYSFCILTSTFNKKNPLIFYRHDERGAFYYVMIDGDKNYVNPINYFLGWADLNKGNQASARWLTAFTILGILFNLAGFIFSFPITLQVALVFIGVAIFVSLFTVAK